MRTDRLSLSVPRQASSDGSTCESRSLWLSCPPDAHQDGCDGAFRFQYDLRLQCSFSAANESDGNFIRLSEGAPENPGTISFAIPKGVHGMPLGREGNGRFALVLLPLSLLRNQPDLT
jgi:hypothetical protein